MNNWVRGLMSRDRLQLSNRAGRGSEAVMEVPQSSATPAASDRDKGDQARDARAWPEAARFYEDYLQSEPEDAAIWVQLGHARKESSDYLGAEAAYRTALSLAANDADVHLQLGHLMKLTGRTREAVDFYSRALRLEPSSNAHRELVGLGQERQADRLIGKVAVGGTEPTMFLQINDLLHFLRVHRTPSGIQRVLLGFISYGLAEAPAQGEPRVEFVFNQPDDVRVWRASRPKLQRLVDYLDQTSVDQLTVRQIVDDIMGDAVLVRPGAGDSFIILGAFWGMPGNTSLMSSLREQGASLGMYLYDLIPITFPEYCTHGLTVAFTRELCEALHFVDFALAISDYTASEMRAFIRKYGFPDIAVEAIPLAHSLTGAQALAAADGDDDLGWTETIKKLQGREFVLCVCTIEPRKNHRYLHDAWKMLKQEGLEVPDLVFVGRKGWCTDDFFAQLANSEYLDGSIVVLHDLSDAELATLYRACRFTVFPSIVEGWGLPVGESLSYGKLCVSSNATSMPEVGGTLVEYIDPLNLRAGVETLRDLILHPEKVADWERKIREQFRPRSWDDVARHFISASSRLHAGRDRGRKTPVAMLKSGVLLRVGDLVRELKLQPVHAYADLQWLALGNDWYPPERFGAWMKGRTGNLGFATDLPAGRGIVIYLQLTAAPNASGLKVAFSGSLIGPEELPIHEGRSTTARLRAKVEDNGSIRVHLKVIGNYDSRVHHPRDFCIGLLSLAIVEEENLIARAEVVEQIMLN